MDICRTDQYDWEEGLDWIVSIAITKQYTVMAMQTLHNG